MKISIIVPTYQEADNIYPLYEHLQWVRAQSQVSSELIFSDGFSPDGTFDRIPEGECLKIQRGKGRGPQMNEGAKIAQGDWLFFVHADSRLHPQTLDDISRSMGSWGCFRLVFDDPHWILAIIAKNSTRRVLRRRIVFGDQGIFIRKDLFAKLGGFPNIPIMEDYQLSLDLKKRQLVPDLRSLPIQTSARRFRKGGILRTMIQMQWYQHRFRQGQSLAKISADYDKDS